MYVEICPKQTLNKIKIIGMVNEKVQHLLHY